MKNFHSDNIDILIRIVGKDDIAASIFKRSRVRRHSRHFAISIMANYSTLLLIQT